MYSAASVEHADAITTLKLLGAQPLEEIPPKAVLYEEAAPSAGLYYLERGIVQLHSSEAAGDNFVFEVLVPGDVFGEESLAASPTYGSFATVLVRTVVWWIPPFVVGEENRTPPAAWFWVADRLVRRHARALQRFSSMCRQDVSMRILSGLVELSQWCPGKDGLEASLPLSQASLAQLVCSTRETVSTKLNRMAADELVDLAPSRIGIPSVRRLKEILAVALRTGH